MSETSIKDARFEVMRTLESSNPENRFELGVDPVDVSKFDEMIHEEGLSSNTHEGISSPLRTTEDRTEQIRSLEITSLKDYETIGALIEHARLERSLLN